MSDIKLFQIGGNTVSAIEGQSVAVEKSLLAKTFRGELVEQENRRIGAGRSVRRLPGGAVRWLAWHHIHRRAIAARRVTMILCATPELRAACPRLLGAQVCAEAKQALLQRKYRLPPLASVLALFLL